MISQPDRAWCPDCRAGRWSHQTTDDGHCKECDGEVVDDWPLWARAYKRAQQAVGVAIFGAIVLGPPAWLVWGSLTYDGPLYATRTVTKTVTETQAYGVIPEYGSLLPIWAILMILIWAGVSGALPRP